MVSPVFEREVGAGENKFRSSTNELQTGNDSQKRGPHFI
jgi:hypothetical protein